MVLLATRRPGDPQVWATIQTLDHLLNNRNAIYSMGVDSRALGPPAYVRAAGMRPITIHDLRHTFASHYMMNGGNIYDLKSLLGHSDLQTTMRYAHLAPQHLKAKSILVSYSVPTFGGVVAIKPNAFNHGNQKRRIRQN